IWQDLGLQVGMAKKTSKSIKNLISAITAFLIFAAGAFSGYFIFLSLKSGCLYTVPLFIKGDILNEQKIEISVSDPAFAENLYKIKNDGRTLKAIPLENIIGDAEPASENYSVYIISHDGRTAKISGSQLEKSYIFCNHRNGWEAINYNHPVSTNIKKIKEIIVVLENRENDFGLNIIDMDKNITYITPGQALLSYRNFFEKSGKSFKDVENKRYDSEALMCKKIIELDDFFNTYEASSLILMGQDGKQEFINEAGPQAYFEINDNSIDYIDIIQNEKIENIKGAVINPSVLSIMDVYYDASAFIENNKNVLFILTDGFGYHQYEYAIKNGYAPFLASIDKAQKALSVYEPVSNAGLAAMLTGKAPDINGIYSRKQREPLVPTIFKDLMDNKKTGALVEGDIQIIKTETDPYLNTDKNKNGTADDEILESALKIAGQSFNFVAVHFHSIDDAGHDWGDIDQRTLKQVQIIDSYIQQLASAWEGKIIITSDHGMHSKADGGGCHGEFRYEDMVVPYIITDGRL
ncbi:MAG: alkaline phosphatase family protein, partial [Actinobacteria bacterium]|nr:alkaline phosphatase family protein [Actinomycetota bacterium]